MHLRLIVLLPWLWLTATAFAQSTAFTYQGQLKNGGQPAAGLHDLRFSLFTAASGGTQVGATQCVNNVMVSEGLLTATLDFGQQFAAPDPRFLQIEVRPDTGLACTSTTGFTVLSPRQAVTAAPTASHAKSAFALDAADGLPTSAVIVDNSGNVGIGTATPTHSVHIANPGPTIALQDTDSTTQQVGYVSYRDSANVEKGWVGYGTAGSPDFSIINARAGGDIVLTPLAGDNVLLVGNGGRVGIGTPAPSARLDVAGDARIIGPLSIANSQINLLSAVNRTYTVHHYDLVETDVGTGGTFSRSDSGLNVFGNPNDFACSLHLPDGATVVLVEVWGHDGSPNSDITATVGRTSVSGAVSTVASVNSSGGGSVWLTTAISNPIVNNNTHAYWLRVRLSGGIPPTDCTLYAVRILYQISTPLP